MPFITPHRKIQRFRRVFSCRVTDPEVEEALRELLAKARHVFKVAVDEEGEWYEQETKPRQRSNLYNEIKERFAKSALPVLSSVSQIFYAKDRGVHIEKLPLVYANRAKSVKAQEEVEVFARDNELALKAGAGPKAKALIVPVDELPDPDWFIQHAEVHDRGEEIELMFVVMRTLESVEKTAEKNREAKKAGLSSERTRRRAFVSVFGKVYRVSSSDASRINKAIQKGADKEKRAKLAKWIQANGELVKMSFEIE